MNNILLLKNIGLLPEIFLGISILYLLIFGSILSTYRTYPLIQNLILNLSILVLIFSLILILNDKLWLRETLLFNNCIAHDYLSFVSKTLILVFSIICLIVIQDYIRYQKINQFEYIIIILLSILGFLILCSANDFITAYLAIELQSLAFYVMSSFKKNSSFSVEAGLKYFILGSFSSAILLFGISLIYCATGSLNFEDYRDLYFNNLTNNNNKIIINSKLNFQTLIDSYCEYMLLAESVQTLNFELYQFTDEIIRGVDMISQYEVLESLKHKKPFMDLEKYRQIYYCLDTIHTIKGYQDYLALAIHSDNVIGLELYKFINLYFDNPEFISTYKIIETMQNRLNFIVFEEIFHVLNSESFMENYDFYSILSSKSDLTLSIDLFKYNYHILNPEIKSIKFADELFIANMDLNIKLLSSNKISNMTYTDIFKLLVTLEHLQYEPNYFTDIFVNKDKFKSFILYNLEEFSKLISETYPKKD